MSYPASLDSFATKTDAVDDVVAADHNAQSTAIVAIETELGALPKGTFGDVKTRLDRTDTIGAAMYRAATSSAAGDTATGFRTMVGYDTSPRVDTGFTAVQATGLITVPSDGYYLVSGHFTLSAAFTAGAAMASINDGTNDLIRSPQSRSSTGGFVEVDVSGVTPWITAGTVLRCRAYTFGSTSLIGDATGSSYYFRVIRL